MSNSHGQIKCSIWHDPHFRALPPSAQRTYMQLLSQPDINWAGVVSLQVDKWATGCDDLTPDDIRNDLQMLAAGKFIVLDLATFELLVRSYMRHTGVGGKPNVLKSAIKSAQQLASEVIRETLALEFERIDVRQHGLFVRVREGFAKGSETLPEGCSVSASESESLVCSNSGGEARAHTQARNGAGAPPHQKIAESQASSNSAPMACPKHPDGPDHDQPCVTCKRVRVGRDQQARKVAEDRAQGERDRYEWERGIHRCELCPDTGMIFRPGPHGEINPHPAALYVRCPHNVRDKRRILEAHAERVAETLKLEGVHA